MPLASISIYQCPLFLRSMSPMTEQIWLPIVGVLILNFFLYLILACPLGRKPQTLSFWDITENVQKKLSNWKYAHISKGERITLIKSSLSSLPTYQLSVFKAPSFTGKKIEKYRRNFLWRGNFDDYCLFEKHKNKLNPIKWSTIIAPKEKGGLGISPLLIQNLFCSLNDFGDTI